MNKLLVEVEGIVLEKGKEEQQIKELLGDKFIKNTGSGMFKYKLNDDTDADGYYIYIVDKEFYIIWIDQNGFINSFVDFNSVFAVYTLEKNNYKDNNFTPLEERLLSILENK